MYALLENAKGKMSESKRFDTICVSFVSVGVHRLLTHS